MTHPQRSPYLISRGYDWVFFLLPPLASLLLGFLLSRTPLSTRTFHVGGTDQTGTRFLVGILIHAHLVAALLRSHGNPAIRRLHPLRFFVVPVLLFLLIRSSAWIALTSTVVAVWWDVWHSGAQTFGFGRIYDRNIGNSPDVGRRLDYWLNLILYAGPIVGGVTLIEHLGQLEGYQELGSQLFVQVPAYAVRWQRGLVRLAGRGQDERRQQGRQEIFTESVAGLHGDGLQGLYWLMPSTRSGAGGMPRNRAIPVRGAVRFGVLAETPFRLAAATAAQPPQQ